MTNKNTGFLVDPAFQGSIFDFLKSYYPSIEVTNIFVTHRHWDHTQDLTEIVRKLEKR